ncbi:MAG: response regulator transcription factor [Candidatus Omnitrophota bacterium]
MSQILIIQDSPSINTLLKFKLESAGFNVDTAETGEEGLEKIKGASYHLVLLDIGLPGIDGREVYRILRKEINGDIPVLFLSAQDDLKLAQIVDETGANGYISISASQEEMTEKIKEYV